MKDETMMKGAPRRVLLSHCLLDTCIGAYGIAKWISEKMGENISKRM